MCIHVRHVQVTECGRMSKIKWTDGRHVHAERIQSSRVRKQSYSLFVTARRDVQQDS